MVRQARNTKLCDNDMTPEICTKLDESRLLLSRSTKLDDTQIDVVLKSATAEAYNLGGDTLFADNIESCINHLVKLYNTGEAHLQAIIRDPKKVGNIWSLT